ncbi:MAG TPA: hypothetical protein VNJ71_00995 [Gemmatimonadales bacterium]|nr:hypothetical protein [Gemmatimonadales bacterium]
MASRTTDRLRVLAVLPGAVAFRAGRGAGRVLAAVALLTIAAGPGLSAQAPAAAAPMLADVPVLPDDTLRDVAVTVPVRGRPVILYNPALLEHVGPDLGRFFLAHEFGHLTGGHTGGALGAEDPRYSLDRRAQELEADCYAARRLAAAYPASVEAAIRFFRLARGFRFDDLHPNGAERAARIAACAPGRAGAEAELAPITVTVPAARAGHSFYGEARLWIDQVPVGTVSNLRAGTRTLTLRGLELGEHTYLVELDVYHLDAGYQLIPLGSVQGSGRLRVAAGDTLVLDWGGADGRTPVVKTAP